MTKKTSIRTCIITKQKCLKKDLLRIVINNNEIIIDFNQNMPGRGHYLVKNDTMLKSEKTKQILLRRFKPTNIDEFTSLLE